MIAPQEVLVLGLLELLVDVLVVVMEVVLLGEVPFVAVD